MPLQIAGSVGRKLTLPIKVETGEMTDRSIDPSGQTRHGGRQRVLADLYDLAVDTPMPIRVRVSGLAWVLDVPTHIAAPVSTPQPMTARRTTRSRRRR